MGTKTETKETREGELLKEATALLMDIALKGEVIGTHVQRAAEFIAKATKQPANSTETIALAA